MTLDAERRRPVPAAVWWLTGLLAVIVVAAVFWGIPHEQDDLTARTEQTLANGGFGEVAVDFEGRDASISGTVPSDTDVVAVEDLVLNVRGVRRVDKAALTFVSAGSDAGAGAATTTTVAPVMSAVGITYDGTQVTLTGTVSTQSAVDGLEDAAETQFGTDQVDTQIEVDEFATSPNWLGSLPEVPVGLAGMLSGSVLIASDGVLVEGAVASVAAADDIAAALADALGLPVDNRLAVPGAASFSVEAANDVITLTGTLPTRADVDATLGSAKEQHETVTDELEVGVVDRPQWVDRLPGLFPATVGWTSWRLDLGEGGPHFTGFAPSARALEALRTGYAIDLGITGEAFAAEMDPAIVAADLTALLEGSTTFASGQTTLSAEARQLLDEVILVLGDNPTTRVTVEGHTDDQGNADWNLLLSQERADAVVAYLVAGGIDEARLTAVGYGEEQPIADNGTSAGRAQNRRIAFVVETEGAG